MRYLDLMHIIKGIRCTDFKYRGKTFMDYHVHTCVLHNFTIYIRAKED